MKCFRKTGSCVELRSTHDPVFRLSHCPKAWFTMRIFLAGATGAIGRLLTPLLVQAGHEVTGTTRSPQKFPAIAAAGARPLALNVLDRDATLTAVQAARPEAVVNMLTDLAGLDYSANRRLRFEGSRTLVEAALAAGTARMVAESIGWMYGPGSGPAREDEPLDLDAAAPRQSAVAAVQVLEGATAEMPTG